MIRALILLSLVSLGKPVLANTADFMHCYDFGCKSVQPVSFSPAQWQSLGEIFARPALSAWLEKQQIRAAVGLMEGYAGAQVGSDQINTPWLDEGLAEYYSTLEIGEETIRIGVPVARHLAWLQG